MESIPCRLLQKLAKDQVCSSKCLREHCAATTKQVSSALDQLRLRGLVKRVSHGVWQITGTGIERFSELPLPPQASTERLAGKILAANNFWWQLIVRSKA